MKANRSYRFWFWALLAALLATSGCGTSGSPDDGDTVDALAADADDVRADLPLDVPADVPPDVPADVPADVPPDAPADVPADVVADVPADVPEDTFDAGPPCTTECCNDADCDDGATCTRDVCGEDGTCGHEPIDCDDFDDCTTDGCRADGSCTHEAIADCCPLTPLDGGSFVFEGGLGSWAVEDRARNTHPGDDPWDQPIVWQSDDLRVHSGAGAAYLGSRTRRTYDNGRRVAAALTSPEVALPADLRSVLGFWVWMDAEPGEGVDALAVTVLVPGETEAQRVPVWTKPADFPQQAWRRVAIDLDAFRGKTVRVELLFDTSDGSVNGFEGVYVDDLTVGTRCAPRTCTADTDCDDRLACTTERCDAGACVYEAAAACCLVALDCDDADACSIDRCQAGTCSSVTVPLPGCCNADTDCNTGDPCTRGRCEANRCETFPSGAADCCEADEDCADELPCTTATCSAATGRCSVEWTCACRYDARCHDDDGECSEDRCVEGQCLHVPSGKEGCCDSELLVDHFEDTTASRATWTLVNTNASVGWTLWDGPSTTSTALYFGNPATGNYDARAIVSGTATSGPIRLPTSVDVSLSFDLYLAVEGGPTHDTLSFALLHGDQVLTLFDKDFQTPLYSWQHITADLSGFAGETVQFRFTFDTRDADGNDGEGVFVDEFALVSTCRPRTCTKVDDCFDGFGATLDRCLDGMCQFEVRPSLCDSDAQCNDGDVCTSDRCVLGGCMFSRITGCCRASSDCEDTDVCTLDSCVGTSPPLCRHDRSPGCCMTARDCDDGNPCTDDVCPGEGGYCDNPWREDCCLVNSQCGDDEPCTADRCVGNACQHTWTCCATNEDCDDGDDTCTRDACADGTCVFTLESENPDCCTPNSVIADFEGGELTGWEVTGGSGTDTWRALTTGAGGVAHAGAGALYFGNASGSGYGSSVNGVARSPVFEIPPGQELSLSFWIWTDTESCCDELTAYLEVEGESVELGQWAGTDEWTEVTFDLTPIGGRTAQLRFEFDSDSSVNERGVFVDDIALASTCAPRECADDSDCPRPYACLEARCLGGGCRYDVATDCCETAGQCDDRDPCTADTCVDEACVHTEIEGCCRSASDCTGESECVVGACVQNRCQLACEPSCPNCCLRRGECDDGDRCTQDDCVDFACTHEDVCCESDDECDDGDDICTTDSCADGFCRFLVDASIEDCCEPTTVLADFEGGSLGDFVTSGNGAGGDSWHYVSTMAGGRSRSGVGALYYGNPAGNGYASSTQGVALSPTFDVPSGQELTLSFWFAREMEGCCDYFRAFLVADGRSYPLGQWNGNGDWQEVTTDLTFLGGRSAQLRFEFTSDGSVTYAGVWVDDLTIASTCAPRACEADGDCTAPTGCVHAFCAAGACVYEPRADCCENTEQCNDNNPCTTEVCTNSVCVFTDVPGCCLRDQDCEDGVACTVDGCVSNRCTKSCSPDCPACCLSSADCVDAEECTRDLCVDSECRNDWVCCAADEDCDDGDDVCTIDSCVGTRCRFENDAENPDCCAAVPFVFDFEDNSLQGFTHAGNGAGGDAWKVVSGTDGDTTHSGRYALWYGSSSAYASNSNGTATSPALVLPAGQQLTLSFWVRPNTESCCDRLTAFLNAPAVGVELALGSWGGTTTEWVQVTADVSALAGQSVLLRFVFQSDSSVTYPGVRVDDIEVQSRCAPVACTTNAQCPVPTGCVEGACVDGGCVFGRAEECCQNAAGCDDGRPCTIDACTDRRCSHVLDASRPACCLADDDCDDGNPCTDDVCRDDTCARACAPECPYDFPWQEDFATALDLASSCWTALDGAGAPAPNWTLVTTGTTAPLLLFDGATAPEGASEQCAVSPDVDTHRALSGELRFGWVQEGASEGATFEARLSSDAGATWTPVWTRALSETANRGTATVDVFEHIQWESSVRVAFCATMNGPAIVRMRIDDVALLGEHFAGEAPTWKTLPEAIEAPIAATTTAEIAATDLDLSPLTFSLADDAPDFVSIEDHDDGTATLSVKPGIGTAGEYTLGVRVTDTTVTVPGTIPLTVVVPGVPPVVDPIGPQRVEANTLLNVRLRATDADGQPLSYTLDAAAPAFVRLRDAGDGTALLTMTPTLDDLGDHVVALVLSDTTQLVPLEVPVAVVLPGDRAPFVEDFEGAADLVEAGWEVLSDETSVTNDWALLPLGSGHAAMFVDFPIVAPFEERLLSPAIDLTGMTRVVIRWKGAFRDYALETATPAVTFQVLVQAAEGSPWVPIFTHREPGDLADGLHEVDASPTLANRPAARIGFRVTGGTSAALLSLEVDDVIVYGTVPTP